MGSSEMLLTVVGKGWTFDARPRLLQAPRGEGMIHTPAISELRKPKASRRTPPGGVPAQGNVLQRIVGAQTNEPMPIPREQHHHQPPPQFPNATPGGQPAMMYGNDASGMPLGLPTPPGMQTTQQSVPGVPPHLQPYLHMQGVPPGYPQYQQANPAYPMQPGYPQMSPGAMYQVNNYPVQPMSLTGQMRLFEVDELPSQYNLGAGRRRWLTYVIAGMLAISLAAIATFLIIRTTRESAPTTGSIHIESVPPGAEVSYDGTRLAGKTPFTIDDVPVGTRHEIKIELTHHLAYTETVDVSKQGGETQVKAQLKLVTGKIVIDSKPSGAEIRINDQLKGRTPAVIKDLDMSAVRKLELRLKDYQPYTEDLVWPASGQIDLMIPLKR